MKKLLLILILCLLTTNAHAATYKNHNYNFQITVPDIWEERDKGEYVFIFFSKSTKEALAIKADHDTKNTPSTTLANMSEIEVKETLDGLISVIKSRYPTAVITYSNRDRIGDDYHLIIKAKFTDNPISLIYSGIYKDRTIFYLEYLNANENYNDTTFYEIAKTIKPIAR